MRAFCCALALLFSASVLAQDRNAPAKKQVVRKQTAAKPKAHSKPTPEQIRKFNELEKKAQ